MTEDNQNGSEENQTDNGLTEVQDMKLGAMIESHGRKAFLSQKTELPNNKFSLFFVFIPNDANDKMVSDTLDIKGDAKSLFKVVGYHSRSIIADDFPDNENNENSNPEPENNENENENTSEQNSNVSSVEKTAPESETKSEEEQTSGSGAAKSALKSRILKK